MSFSSISIGQSNDTFFALQKGFSGISIIGQIPAIQSVEIIDNGGNIGSFAITNAVLKHIDNEMPDKPITFAANSFVSNETMFYFGEDPEKITLSFEISGLTMSLQPFSYPFTDISPVINYI